MFRRINVQPPPPTSDDGRDLLLAVALVLPLAFGLVQVWPPSNPYEQSVVHEAQVFLWKWPFVSPLLASVSFVAFAAADVYKIRLQPWLVSVFFAGIVVVVVGTMAIAVAPLLESQYYGALRGWTDCIKYCSSPFEMCHTPRISTYNATTPVLARAQFRERLIGSAANVSVVLYQSVVAVYVENTQTILPIEPGSGSDGMLVALQNEGHVTFDGLLSLYKNFIHVPRLIGGIYHSLATRAAVATEIARKARLVYPRVDLYGCSTSARAALWAVVNNAGLFNTVYLDAPGIFYASILEVGPCGQTLEALVDRHPEDFMQDARADVHYDVSDAIGDACFATNFVVSHSTFDSFENPVGFQRTTRALQERGCVVQTIPEKGQHACSGIRVT